MSIDKHVAGGQVAFDKKQNPSSNKGNWKHIEPKPRNVSGASRVEPSWQPLVETQQVDEDLVSIFQDDYDLNADGARNRDREITSTTIEPAVATQMADEETRPFIVAPFAPEDEETVYDITLYLAPRATNHFLVKGLARQLRFWLPELCKTYGWELESLSVRPDYLRWTLRDFPERLTREMLKIIRTKLSQRIFRVYPNLKDGVTWEDFWAPGYLVDTQNRDYSTQALLAYVAKNRLVD